MYHKQFQGIISKVTENVSPLQKTCFLLKGLNIHETEKGCFAVFICIIRGSKMGQFIEKKVKSLFT